VGWLPPKSELCNECGAAVAAATTPAEYKQATVLFADLDQAILRRELED
jgi:hypothetical protein